MKKLVTTAFLALITIGISGLASAQATSVTTDGGNLSQEDLTATKDATTWSGFYGDLTGTVELGDGTDNLFTWTASDPSGSVIYAVPGSNTNDPTTATLSEVTTGSNADTITGTSGTEAASNTYVDGSNNFQTLSPPTNGNVGNQLTGATAGVDTNSGSGSFTSYLAEDTGAGGEPVFFTESLNAETGFDSGTYDYQLLVTAGDDFTGQTIDFYAELS